MKKVWVKCRASIIVFLIIGTIAVSFPLGLHGDEETLDRVLREAPQAWSVARRKFSKLEVSFTSETYEIKSGSKVADLYLEGKIRQLDDLCFRVEGESRRSRESVPTAYWAIGNPYYLATLGRREPGADSVLVVQKLKRRNEDFPGKSNNEVFNWHLQRLCYPGFQFGEECLFDCFVNLKDCFHLVRHTNLRIVDATSNRDSEGREVVILSLKEVLKTENGLEEIGFTSVEMKLLPDKNWALLEFQRKAKGKILGSPDPDNELDSVYSITFHYTDDFFFPTKVLEEFRMGTHTTYEKATFGPSVPSSLKSSDCRLPAFGLTEPKDLVPRTDAVKYVLVFLGLMALLGVVFYFRRTK